MHEDLRHLISTNASKHREEVDKDLSRYYNLCVKDLYLTNFYYKGFKFTVTGVECIAIDMTPDIKYDNTNFVIRQTFGYEWNLELSLSIINKVKLNLKDYKRLMNGTYGHCRVLDEAIKRELVINE